MEVAIDAPFTLTSEMEGLLAAHLSLFGSVISWISPLTSRGLRFLATLWRHGWEGWEWDRAAQPVSPAIIVLQDCLW